MAKKSKIVAQKKREKLVAQYAERRAELKAIMKCPTASLDERMEASRKLSRLPRDSSPVRLRNRCLLYTSPSPRDRQKSRMPSSA